MEDQVHNQIQQSDARKMQWRILIKLLSGIITYVIVFFFGAWLLIRLKVVTTLNTNVTIGLIVISYVVSTIVMRSINRKRKV